MQPSRAFSYFLHILPNIDYNFEQNRNAFLTVIKRLEKFFQKVGKRGAMRRRTNWAALANWLKGIYDLIKGNPFLAHHTSLRVSIGHCTIHARRQNVTNTCLRIVVGESSMNDDASSSSVVHHSTAPTIISAQTPPAVFAQAALKLTGFLSQVLPENLYNLETICSPGDYGLGVSSDRIETVLCLVLIPMFIRAATARKGECMRCDCIMSRCTATAPTRRQLLSQSNAVGHQSVVGAETEPGAGRLARRGTDGSH